MSLTEPELRQALMECGSLPPMNVKAVEAVRQNVSGMETTLPPNLSCDRILDRVRSGSRQTVILKFPRIALTTPAAAGLARAARNGEELPDDIVAEMQSDREQAEGQS